MNYKKTKFSSIIFLSALLLVSTVNMARADPLPSYVGISLGEHVWTIDPKADGIDGIITDYEIMTNETIEKPAWFNDDLINLAQGEIAINVSGNGGSGITSGGVAYTNITCTGEFRVLGLTLGDGIPEFEIPILDATSNYFNETIKLLNSSLGGFTNVNDGTFMLIALFVSNGMNWTNVETDFIAARDEWLDTDSQGNVTIKALTDGINITIADGFFNDSINEISLSMQYNTDGVLTTGILIYDGDIVVNITTGSSSIPGFEIPLIIGASALSIVGLIYAVKKKRKIIS